MGGGILRCANCGDDAPLTAHGCLCWPCLRLAILASILGALAFTAVSILVNRLLG